MSKRIHGGEAEANFATVNIGPTDDEFSYPPPLLPKRGYDRVDYKMHRKEPHECVPMWSFTMTVHNIRNTSPRRFTTMQEALAAIGERMAMHAQDNEFPMFALVRFKR